MHVRIASTETTMKPHFIVTDDALTIPPKTTKTITASVDHPSEWNLGGTVTPLEKTTETASLLISHSVSTLINKKTRVTKTPESPYLIKKHTVCRALRSHSGAIQVYQTNRYGNPQYDSGRWSRSDFLSERISQNENARAAKQIFLILDTWKPWPTRKSHPNTATNP